MSETEHPRTAQGLPPLGKSGKQPARGPGDGPANIHVDHRRGYLVLSAEQDGTTTEVVVSPYNAWRLFAMLTIFLGIKLPAKLGNSIKL